MQGEAIYKGATRPAMKLGIPLVPLVVLFGTGMLLIMCGGTLESWWIALGVVVAFVPALLWMRFVTSQDDQRFRQMFVAMKLRLHDRNRRFWHARSYAPTLTDCKGLAPLLFVVRVGIEDSWRQLQAFNPSVPVWLWHPSREAIPALPPRQPHATRATDPAIGPDGRPCSRGAAEVVSILGRFITLPEDSQHARP